MQWQILTINDNICEHFKHAYQALNLLEDDQKCHNCLHEASINHTASQLRNLFVYILQFCSFSQPMILFQYFKNYLIEDFLNVRRLNLNEDNALDTATNGFLCALDN